MTVDELKIYIDESIRLNKSFAFFRLPQENKISYVFQECGSVSVFLDIENLNKKSGFIIAPFSISAEYPVVMIEGTPETLDFNPEAFTFPSNTSYPRKYEPVSSEYRQKFKIFIHALQEKELDKLVLSRKVEYKREKTFSPGIAFLKACKRYIRSYVYIYHTPQTGTWLGGTPEIILSGNKENLNTVALAGTQPLRNNELPTGWDKKNMEEQRYVSEYIKNQLHTFGVEAKEDAPYTVRAGELAHLKSDFRFSLPDSDRLGDLLKLLHPTPAVCGLPKEEAYHFILQNEGYNRKYYSGFIGLLNSTGISNIYVNLRCMNIADEHLTLYAGGGLLSSSTLLDEWQETEDKLFTMGDII